MHYSFENDPKDHGPWNSNRSLNCESSKLIESLLFSLHLCLILLKRTEIFTHDTQPSLSSISILNYVITNHT